MFFSVPIGPCAGVFLDWNYCQAAVCDYSNCAFRKCKTLSEATQYMNQCGYTNEDIFIQTPGKSQLLQEYCKQHELIIPAEVAYTRQNLFDLGCGLHVKASCSQGTSHIEIKVWDSNKRTRKGISLTLQQWDKFLAISDQLEAALEKVKAGDTIKKCFILDLSLRCEIKSPFRVFCMSRLFKEDNKTKSGREEITLREQEWRQLLDLKDHLQRALQYE